MADAKRTPPIPRTYISRSDLPNPRFSTLVGVDYILDKKFNFYSTCTCIDSRDVGSRFVQKHKPFSIKCPNMSLIFISEYNQTYHTHMYSLCE